MNVVDARNNLADAINRVAYAGERIVLERRGKGVAALISIADLATLEELENQADIQAAKKALKEKHFFFEAKTVQACGENDRENVSYLFSGETIGGVPQKVVVFAKSLRVVVED